MPLARKPRYRLRRCRPVVLIWMSILLWVFAAPALAQRLPATATPQPAPEAVQRIVQPPFALELFFEDLPQAVLAWSASSGMAPRGST